MTSYEKGEKVEYHPIGGHGGGGNVARSTGIITKVSDAEDGTPRFTIKNDNTGKETTYQETNIIGRA